MASVPAARVAVANPAAEPELIERAREIERQAKPLISFWTKINNDWIFSLSSQLAYTLLFSIFPILLLILVAGTLLLDATLPSTQAAFEAHIAGALPGGAKGTGGVIVSTVHTNLHHSTGIFFAVGMVVALFSGSRLFVSVEGAFSIIFRLPKRGFIAQNMMALAMMALYTLLVPLVLLGSILPNALLGVAHSVLHTSALDLLFELVGILIGSLAGFILFGAIYVVVPNRRVRWHEVWRGALVAAGLVTCYELLFPIYQSTFLHAGSYGALAGFAIVLLTFFYYLGFILLLGAEVNAWVAGHRDSKTRIADILREVGAKPTPRGARAEVKRGGKRGGKRMPTPMPTTSEVARDESDQRPALAHLRRPKTHRPERVRRKVPIRLTLLLVGGAASALIGLRLLRRSRAHRRDIGERRERTLDQMAPPLMRDVI